MGREEVFSFLSKDETTKIHAVRWMPDGEIKAILQITHGMVEFIERYREFAQFLTEHGFLVVGHDHIGHGESVASNEDWGYFTPKNPSDILVADMHRLRSLTQQTYPKLPYFMMGHSMGSYMLRKYLTMHGEGVSGAIVMGTGYVPNISTRLGICVVRVMAKFKGWHYRSRLVQKLTFGGAYKQFDMNGTDYKNSWLTKDEDIVAFCHSEPKCMFTFTLSGYLGLFEAVFYDNQKKNIAKTPKTLPLFLVSGKDDPVGDLGKGVLRVYGLYRAAGVGDVTCRLYENDRHEILNETDRENVYKELLDWLSAHLK